MVTKNWFNGGDFILTKNGLIEDFHGYEKLFNGVIFLAKKKRLIGGDFQGYEKRFNRCDCQGYKKNCLTGVIFIVTKNC